MATKAKDVHDPVSVTAHIQQLDPALAAIVLALRKLILQTDKEIGEQIKWNSPSFFYTGAMQPFDPKDYKRDIAVMHLRKGVVMLVFPTGAVINDDAGLLEGDYKDGRRMMTFKNMEAVNTNGDGLQRVIKSWLEKVEK